MAEISQAVIDTLIAEAIGEGPEGMRRVAETILNRAAIRGLTPEQVVKQPKQYTGYEAPGADTVTAMKDPAVRAAAEAAFRLAMEPGDPTKGADHYFNPNLVSPSWARSMTPTGQKTAWIVQKHLSEFLGCGKFQYDRIADWVIQRGL